MYKITKPVTYTLGRRFYQESVCRKIQTKRLNSEVQSITKVSHQRFNNCIEQCWYRTFIKIFHLKNVEKKCLTLKIFVGI